MAIASFKKVLCRQEGGIKDVILIACDDPNYVPVVANAVCTSVAEDLAKVTGYVVENDTDLGTATQTPTGNAQAGTFFYGQEVAIKGRAITQLSINLQAEVAKKKWHAIVRYHNGINRLFGAEFGLFPTGGSDSGGEGLASDLDFSVVLTGNEINTAPTVSDAVITSDVTIA